MLSIRMSTAAACSCGVYHEMCAVIRTFGCCVEPVAGGQRLRGRRCRASPCATVPSSSATRSASWSTSAPRAMLTRCTPGVILANAAASMRWRVLAVDGAASTTCCGAGQQLVERADDLDAGDRARRVGAAQRTHLHPERQRARRDRLADPAEADERERRTLDPVERRASGSSSTSAARRGTSPGKRFAHARIAAITHSEIGTALAPRAHVTIRS